MAWYDPKAIPQWRVLISKPFSFQQLLNSKDSLMKQVIVQSQIQNYLIRNKKAIIQKSLFYCLRYPLPDDSHQRKIVIPAKTIEMMTNQLFFACLGWDKESIYLFVNLLFLNFKSVDPKDPDINIYHAYLERLFKMLLQCQRTCKLDIVGAIQQQQNINDFVGMMFGHGHKLSVILCLEMILSVDFVQHPASTSSALKNCIFEKIYANINKYSTALDRQSEGQMQELTQNCFLLIKNYLEKGIKYTIDNGRTDQLTASMSPIIDKKIQDFLYIYNNFFIKNIGLMVSLLKKNTVFCLKTIIMQILQLNHIFLMKSKRNEIDHTSATSFIQGVLAHMLTQKVTLLSPYVIQWMIIVCSQLGEKAELGAMLVRVDAVSKTVKMLVENKVNNIMGFRLVQFLKLVMGNAQKEVVLAIQKNKTSPQNIKFVLMNLMLVNLHPLNVLIASYKSPNQPLFFSLYKFYKIVYNYFRNILDVLSHYQAIQVCKIHKVAVIQFMEFYGRVQCFRWFEQNVLNVDLGGFKIEAEIKDVQYNVVNMGKNNKKIQEEKKMTDSFAISVGPPIQLQTTNTLNENFKVSPNTQINLKDTNISLQQTTSNDTIVLTSPQKSIEKIRPGLAQITDKQLEETPNKTSLDSSAKQTEDSSERFNKYMSSKLKQVQNIYQERRSKSRTPTKMTSQKKNKTKNKWADTTNQQPQQSASKSPFSHQIPQRKKTKAFSSPKMSKEMIESTLPKISLIRLTKARIPQNKVERTLDGQKDGRLMVWLGMLRSAR